MSGTLYSGVAANVNLANAAQGTVPADGDPDNAATFTVGTQKLYDYAEALRGAIQSFSEGFESATFPPTATAGWATPSPRFGTDSSWVRSTTNPIAGTASASAPVPQTLSTNSSLGFDVAFVSPARISFLFAVNGNANTSDVLQFLIDGVLTGQFSSRVSNTLVAGRFVSDVLPQGSHTFAWRWVRGASASVAAEECKIDTVEIIPDAMVAGDPTKIFWMNEGFIPSSGTITTGQVAGDWSLFTNANPGTFGKSTGNISAFGSFFIRTGAVAIGDWATAALQMQDFNGFSIQALNAYTEMRVSMSGSGVTTVFEDGFIDKSAFNVGSFVGWAFDGANGAGSNWRWRSISSGGAAVNVDSGIAQVDGTWFRFGVSVSVVRGVTSAVFTKDGKALAGAAGVPPILTGWSAVAGTGNSLVPGMRVRSISVISSFAADLDWMRLLALRP